MKDFDDTPNEDIMDMLAIWELKKKGQKEGAKRRGSSIDQEAMDKTRREGGFI
jgi:hypothetical protein